MSVAAITHWVCQNWKRL